MRKLALVLVASAGLALAGCATTATGTSSVGGSASVTTKADAEIAAVSATLAKQCTLLNVAVATGETFVRSAKVQKALVAADAALDQFCAAPPSNVNTAIASVASMAIAVNQALATARET